ncbi:trichohyalin isoform X2 [Pocillopora verrucosa]|uniref:trichohyalin isoform X2 n=1 Tax=Pocillopora verrucosa TaxID=203993 RepID=UPI00333FEF18
MAGQYSKPTSSRSGRRRESLEGTSHEQSLPWDVEFIQKLRKLPDELTRLYSENSTLKREAEGSPSRLDSSRKRIEKFWQERLETREKELKNEQEDRILQMRKHYEQLAKNDTETLQKNNTELQNRLRRSLEICNKMEEENKTLQKKLKESERQLQETVNSSHSRDASERHSYEYHLKKTKQALEEKRRELDRFKERHAAFSEKRVRSDQRRTENTLSTNRQSQLENDYVIEFKDGTRVDAIDIIYRKTSRSRGNKSTSAEYLKCCRLACLIFEVAYGSVLSIKKTFATFTSAVIEVLVTEAPAIGSDTKSFPLWKVQCGHTRDVVFATQDAVAEVMVLVKEGAKNHNLHFLEEDVMSSICSIWLEHFLQRKQLLPEYDRNILHSLKDYIQYCIQFAWCAVTQVPPLKIDHTTTVYSSKSHIISQAFSLTDQDRGRSRRSYSSEARNIICYLWPTLLDCDGKVISKGEVILAH